MFRWITKAQNLFFKKWNTGFKFVWFFYHNGSIRIKTVKQIPRTVVPGICFVRVIVIDFNFVFVDYDCKFFI